MYRYLILTLLILFAAASAGAAGSGDDIGFGIIAGEPTGLCMKAWLGTHSAFDAAVAWSFSKEDALHLHGDYILHSFGIFNVEKGRMPLYYGIGGRIKFADKSEVGLRVPVGLDYMITNNPLDIFLEIVPLLDLAPDTEIDLNAAVGVRYFF